MSNNPTEDKRTRPFADFLAEHNKGVGHLQAGEALQRVVAAVVETGKAGAVTVKVSVAPMKGAAGTLITTINVDEKLPANPPKAAVFYADDDGNLVRNDPNQAMFEGLKEVEAPEVRDPKAQAAPRVVGGDR